MEVCQARGIAALSEAWRGLLRGFWGQETRTITHHIGGEHASTHSRKRSAEVFINLSLPYAIGSCVLGYLMVPSIRVSAWVQRGGSVDCLNQRQTPQCSGNKRRRFQKDSSKVASARGKVINLPLGSTEPCPSKPRLHRVGLG